MSVLQDSGLQLKRLSGKAPQPETNYLETRHCALFPECRCYYVRPYAEVGLSGRFLLFDPYLS